MIQTLKKKACLQNYINTIHASVISLFRIKEGVR
jgi:hypothetical protein